MRLSLEKEALPIIPASFAIFFLNTALVLENFWKIFDCDNARKEWLCIPSALLECLSVNILI